MGISVEDFLNMSLDDFNVVADAYEQKTLETIQMSWEQTRWLASILIQPHLKKGKSLKPTDLIEFEWDKKNTKKTKKMTPEMLKNRTQKILKI